MKILKKKDIEKAIGKMSKEFEIGDNFFFPMPKPGKDDWLNLYDEEAQPFSDFVKTSPTM